jgi:hypothetical protein
LLRANIYYPLVRGERREARLVPRGHLAAGAGATS